jgi:predicted SprT family Zn-dependent metalloprotease
VVRSGVDAWSLSADDPSVTVSLPPADELQHRAVALFGLWRVADASVRVVWNDRLTTTAGRAFLQLGQIELNPRLLQRAADQVEPVLVHEAAHLAAHRLFGPNIPAHGRHWRSLMRLAGQPPAVTHDIPVQGLRRVRRRYLYLRVCGDCGDRLIAPVLRYGRCHGCNQRDGFLVLKAPATAAGQRALESLPIAAVRERCRQA